MVLLPMLGKCVTICDVFSMEKICKIPAVQVALDFFYPTFENCLLLFVKDVGHFTAAAAAAGLVVTGSRQRLVTSDAPSLNARRN